VAFKSELVCCDVAVNRVALRFSSDDGRTVVPATTVVVSDMKPCVWADPMTLILILTDLT
jgi:hypothetical protein